MIGPKQDTISRREAILIWLRGDSFNRFLNQTEKDDRLSIKKHHDVTPIDRNMVIRYNSAFLEMVQPLYRAKGFIEAFYLIMFIIAMAYATVAFTGLSFIYPYVWDGNPDAVSKWVSDSMFERLIADIFWFFSCLFALLMSLHCLDFLIHNTYPYTHSAIRFCRKSRRVYAYAPKLSWFTRSKTFIDVAWDDAYFLLYNAGPLVPGVEEYRWFLALYELDKNSPRNAPKVVNGVMFGVPAKGSDELDTLMLGQWEFIRRYMEEGPESIPTPTFMLPIAKKRESFFLGWKMLRESHGFNLFTRMMFLPFMPFAAVMRYFQMHVAPVLKWPAEVEAACKVEAYDPYHYEANRKCQAVKVNP